MSVNCGLPSLDRESSYRDFLCDVCNKFFTNQKAKLAHLQKVHGGKAKYFCAACKSNFRNDASFMEHFDDAHRDGKGQYRCPLCARTFSVQTNFQRHQRNHLYNMEHPLGGPVKREPVDTDEDVDVDEDVRARARDPTERHDDVRRINEMMSGVKLNRLSKKSGPEIRTESINRNVTTAGILIAPRSRKTHRSRKK